MKIENEQGVIIEFVKQSMNTDWEIVKIQTRFPDAIIKHKDTRETYLVEFEFLASNFLLHDHDIRGCDLIICWENDWLDCILPIWTMSDWHTKTAVRTVNIKDKEIAHLLNQNRKLRDENNRLKKELFDIDNIQQEIDYTKTDRQQISLRKEKIIELETEKTLLDKAIEDEIKSLIINNPDITNYQICKLIWGKQGSSYKRKIDEIIEQLN